jgi:hypothetical protein
MSASERGVRVCRLAPSLAVFVALLGLAVPAAAAENISAGPGDDPLAEEPPRRELTVEHIEDLQFGVVVADPSRHGAVTIDADSGRKRTSGGAYDFGGRHGRAELRLSGEPDAPFVVLLPDRVPLEGPHGGAELSDLAVIPDQFGRLGPDGYATVYIGATLRVRPAMGGNRYGGIFHILAEYQ